MTHIKVLSAGSIRRGVAQVAALYEQKSGNHVECDFMSTPKVRARAQAYDPVDVVIASASAMSELESSRHIDGATRVSVGRARMGVVMRKGADAPDLASAGGFKRAMFSADAIACNQGSSGAYAAKLIEKLELGASGKPKISVLPSGAELMAFVANGAGRNYGLVQITSVIDAEQKGQQVTLAGVLPDEYQNVTTYEAAIATASSNAIVARGLIRMIGSAEGRRILSAAGLD